MPLGMSLIVGVVQLYLISFKIRQIVHQHKSTASLWFQALMSMQRKDTMDAPISVLESASTFIRGMEEFPVHGWELENTGTKQTTLYLEHLVFFIIARGPALIILPETSISGNSIQLSLSPTKSHPTHTHCFDTQSWNLDQLPNLEDMQRMGMRTAADIESERNHWNPSVQET